MPRQRVLNERQARRVLIMRKAGRSYQDIGDYFGVSFSSVKRACERIDGPQPSREEMNQQRINRAVALAAQGLTHRQISESMGLNRGTARKLLIKAGAHQAQPLNAFSILRHRPVSKPMGEVRQIPRYSWDRTATDSNACDW